MYIKIKNELYNLNLELDKYDNKNKNKFDQSIFESLDDPERCFYLIEDIFDNYRPKSMNQIYSTDETNKIHEV